MMPDGQLGQAAPQRAASAANDTAFWPDLVQSLRAELSVRERGFFTPNGPVHPVLKDDTLTLAADTDFVLNIIRKPAVQELVQKKASAALGRPIAVRFARKDQVSENGNDPMDALVAFGGQHNDIFTIK